MSIRDRLRRLEEAASRASQQDVLDAYRAGPEIPPPGQLYYEMHQAYLLRQAEEEALGELQKLADAQDRGEKVEWLDPPADAATRRRKAGVFARLFAEANPGVPMVEFLEKIALSWDCELADLM